MSRRFIWTDTRGDLWCTADGCTSVEVSVQLHEFRAAKGDHVFYSATNASLCVGCNTRENRETMQSRIERGYDVAFFDDEQGRWFEWSRASTEDAA